MARETFRSSGAEKPVLHLIPGVSGSGKTTAGRYVVDRLNSNGITIAKLVVPHTTRPKRLHERDGIDYHFHTPEDFAANYAGKCNQPGSDWVVSEIGGHHYFNTDSATRPTIEQPVSVLPVAYSAFDEVIAEHTTSEYDLSVLPIVIRRDIQDRWLPIAQSQRPNRHLAEELEEQAAFLERYDGEVFYPVWEGQADLERYYNHTQALLSGARMIINTTMEVNFEPNS